MFVSCSTLSRTIQTVVNVGPWIRFIRTTDLFIQDHPWSWLNCPDDKLVLIARQLVLPTQMTKFRRAIKPPCGENEPQPTEA